MGPFAVASSLVGLLCIQFGHVNGGIDNDFLGGGEAPHITEQPLDVTVARHQPATLNCRAGGSPPPTIRWYKDGAAVAADAHRVLLPAGALFFLRAAHGRMHSDAGVYWCEATNPYGTARSRNATIHVAVLRDEFRLEPVSAQTAQGETVLLECAPPRGTPEPTIFWKKNGQVMRFEGDPRMQLVDGGSLVIQDARQSDAGRYQCVAKNAAGTRESVVAILRIHIKPYLITGPDDVIAHTGGSVTFQCRVGGDPLPDVLWRRTAGGGNMPFGRVKVLDDRSLRLDAVTIADEGEYTCEADNSVGAVSASGYLTVYDPPTISLKKMSVNVEIGGEATFECSATGRPEPTMFWSLEGNRTLIFPGTSRGRFNTTLVVDGVTTLTISDSKKNDSGSIIVCSAVNFAGSTFVRGRLRITSDDDRPPPVITHGPSNQTLPIKSMAIFPCSATGSPIPVVSWYHEGVALLQNNRRNISEEGTLTIKDLEKSDSGTYTCVAASPNGKYVWSGVLIVDAPTNPSLHFFRAPDVSTLPGSPTKPHVVNHTDGSITISWTQNNKIGSSSLIGYQVEMFVKDVITGKNIRNTNGWVTLTQRLHETHFIANKLNPGMTYIFLVRAENAHGLSAPSILSDPITIGQDSKILWENGIYNNVTEIRSNLMTDDIVQLIEATPLDSITIKVMWEVLNFYYLEGLFIYYRPLETIQNVTYEYKMKTILHSNDVSGFEITNLEKYTKYEFFLVPFYKKFEGKPSNSRVTRTLDDAPDGPPTNIEMSIINSTTVHLKWSPLRYIIEVTINFESPGGPPTNIEMSIINSTTVHLKWSPPKPDLQNGQITGYNVLVNWLDIGANKSMVSINTTVHSATSLIMTNLTSGVSYTVQVAAATVVGFGPYSPIVYLNIDSKTIGLDPMIRYPMNNDVSIVAGDFVMETWFLLLIGAIGILKILLIGAIIFFRKHNLFAKKASLPNIYDSNGTSLVTQMNIKAAVSLSHPLTSCYSKNSVTKTESLLWMENQPGLCLSNNIKTEKEKSNPEYDRVAQPLPEYAEVTSSRVTANEWNTNKTATSPAAYASVTLVANTRQCVSSLGWFPSSNKKVESYDARYNQDEEIYPASNGGYYNRNVYADKYFQAHPNVIKFYDLPDLDGKAQKAQLRYNQSLDGERRSNVTAHEMRTDSQSLAGRPYGVERKNSETEATYRAFSNAEESDEENYEDEEDDDKYDNVRSMQPLRGQHQYARPTFDNEPARNARFTSFRNQNEQNVTNPAFGPSAPSSIYGAKTPSVKSNSPRSDSVPR